MVKGGSLVSEPDVSRGSGPEVCQLQDLSW